MKLTFKPSPNYRNPQSTTGIMRDLTVCLFAITVFSVAYYSATLGANAGLRVIILMVTSILSALVTEAIYFKATKQDIKEGITSSYGWVTAMILTLISSINVTPYALAVCTVLAIVFGKLVFGGFGQNIFNPAAFGEAILMNSFAGSNIDLLTTTTPTVAMNKFSWLGTSTAVGDVISKYNGLGNMFLGLYPSTIGSTCALLLILCFIFLVVREDIDWQTSVFYVGSVFVVTLIIGLVHGTGISYALMNVLAGGVLFGGVFMVTDPVTTPVTLPGKIAYGIGAGCFTVLFRLKSNMSDGVLYSILLMNMLTPAIDKLFDGNQIKDAAKIRNKTILTSAVSLAMVIAVGALSSVKEPDASTPSASNTTGGTTGAAVSTDSANASCTDNGDGTYACTADGFPGESLTATIEIKDGAVASIELGGNNGDGVGDDWFDDASSLIGVKSADEVDTISGGTMTTTGVKAMIEAAFNTANGVTTGTTSNTTSNTTTAAADGCTANGDDTYTCSAEGFPGESLTATIEIKDGAITSIELGGNNGDGVGDDWFDDASSLIGIKSADEVDLISGGTMTTTGVKTMIENAFKAANGGAEETTTAAGNDVCTENADGTFACSAEGFNGEKLTATIEIKDGAIASIELAGNNGDGVGEDWFEDSSSLVGVTSADDVDLISGATYTSTGVKTMIEAAFAASK